MPTFGTTRRLYGAFNMQRPIFRQLLTDARWLFYAEGWVDPGDANTATVELVYEEDDQTITVLGSVTQAGAGRVKKSMGPFDLFGTIPAAQAEIVPIVRLAASKDAGVDGTLDGWNIWVRLLPALK